MFGSVNYLAAGVAALVHFCFGALWYAVLFSKKWIAEMNVDEAKMKVMEKRRALSFVLSLIGSFFLAYVASRMVTAFGPANLVEVILLALFCWAGFALLKELQDVGYEGDSWTLFLINAGYYIIGFIIVFVILYYWK